MFQFEPICKNLFQFESIKLDYLFRFLKDVKDFSFDCSDIRTTRKLL